MSFLTSFIMRPGGEGPLSSLFMETYGISPTSPTAKFLLFEKDGPEYKPVFKYEAVGRQRLYHS